MQHLVLSGGSGAHGGARRNAALPRHRTPDGVLMAAGQGLTRVVQTAPPLTFRHVRGDQAAFLAPIPMGSIPPRCEIRRLLIHTYAGGSRSADQERITVFYGRRGKPLKKPRFIPAALAHQLARKLAGRGLGTVSVL
jgi:hypothetical protein